MLASCQLPQVHDTEFDFCAKYGLTPKEARDIALILQDISDEAWHAEYEGVWEV